MTQLKCFQNIPVLQLKRHVIFRIKKMFINLLHKNYYDKNYFFFEFKYDNNKIIIFDLDNYSRLTKKI